MRLGPTFPGKGQRERGLGIPARQSFGQPVLSAHLAFQSGSTFGYDPDPFTHEPGYARSIWRWSCEGSGAVRST